MDETRGKTIHFTDGSKLSFQFPRRLEEGYNTAARLEHLLDKQHLLVEAEGLLYMFPLQNIKYVQVYPSPSPLPDTAVEGASLLD